MLRSSDFTFRRSLSVPLLLSVLLLFPDVLTAQDDAGPPAPWQRFEAGSMELIISRFGRIGYDRERDGTHGLSWPGPPPAGSQQDITAHGLLHSATPVLVGTVRGERRVSASYYRDIFRPGPIVEGLRTVNPDDAYYRPYTISINRPDQQDYREWPVGLGAPFYAFQQPYFFGAEQMYWVMNDLDSTLMRQYLGSDPMGIEIRCLVYGPFGSGTLNDDYMMLQFTYVNRSRDTIRDAYTGFFADVDIRDGLDDLPGSDSVRALVYAYDFYEDTNGELSLPAAFGVCMVQTPAVRSTATDSARWKQGWKPGWRNIPVTAAVIPTKSGHSQLTEPPFGEDAPAQWDALMRGEGRSTAVRNPTTGAPTRFWFSGDPVQETGWLPRDGYLLGDGSTVEQGAADQRMLISSGPFTLAPEDTQQVVVALIASRGATRQAAVHGLRDRAEFLRARHLGHPAATALSNTVVTTIHDNPPFTSLRVIARSEDPPLDVQAELSGTGSAPARVPMQRTRLGDAWVYNADIDLTAGGDGIDVSLIAGDGIAEDIRVPGRVSVPVAGDVVIPDIRILQEGDGNGRIAPDEEARWFPVVRNEAVSALRLYLQHPDLPVSQWMQLPLMEPGTEIPSATLSWLPQYGHRTVFDYDDRWGIIFDSVITEYDAWDPGRNNWWLVRSSLPVDSSAAEWYDVLMTQVRGVSNERPGVRIIDRDALLDRWYVVSVSGSGGGRVLAMKDSVTDFPFFDDYGVDVFTGALPVTHGFRVVRGTIAATRSALPHYAFRESNGAPRPVPVFRPQIIGSDVQENADYADVRLVVDSALGQPAWHYRDGQLQGPVALPLRAYRKIAEGEWQQVEIGLSEDEGAVPYESWTGGFSERLIVFNVPRGSEWAPPFDLPRYWSDLAGLLSIGADAVPDRGSYEFMFHIPADARDLYVFNPRHALLARSNKPAAAATLHPPAPVPFSEWTSAVIELRQGTPLRAEVYSMLGQRVSLLRDNYAEAGRHLLIWDGRWDDGRPADSGVYLLRVHANGGEVTRKVVIVR